MMRLIDADALIEQLMKEPKVGRLSFEAVLNAVKNMEPIEERKTGRWVGADSQCGIGCTFCGTPVDDFCSSIDYIDLRYKPNFCPNCGAKMER